MRQKEPVWILHDTPGRLRLGFKEDKKDIPNLDKFFKISGVREVSFNKLTKSLLISYDEKITSKEKLLKEIGKRFLEIKLKPETQKQIQKNVLSEVIYSSGSRINRRTHQALKGYADLTSIIPTVLFLWGIEELIRNPVMPKWYDILRASDSMFARFGQHYHYYEE